MQTQPPDFASLHPGYKKDARHRPVFTPATGQAVLPVPCLPKGACGTLGKRPLPRPPASQAGIPHTAGKDSGTRAVAQLMRAKIASPEPGPRKQPFACVPHTDGFVGLLDVPGMAACASVPPFVRAVARTCTRAVRALCRGLPERLSGKRPSRHPRPSKFADLRVPFHAARPLQRAPYRYGTEGMIVVLLRTSRTK